jgi:hypothetical protein
MTDGVSILIGEKVDKEEEEQATLLLISLSCLYNRM